MVSGSPFKGLYLFLCGMCMGASDLIPGISGGTIAFILGFYTPLLDSLKSFNYDTFKLILTGNGREFFRKTQCGFLFTLLAGIILSFILLANAIHLLLGHPVYRVYLYSAFFGLILASFYFCMKRVRKWTIVRYVGLVLGILTAFLLTSLSFTQNDHGGNHYAIKIEIPEVSFPVNNYQAEENLLTALSAETLGQLLDKGIIQSDTLIFNETGHPIGNAALFSVKHTSSFLNLWLMFCGAIAVCALLLPGISGSYLLTLLGAYPLIIGSLADWIAQLKRGVFDFDSFSVLLNLGIGIIIGAMLFSRVLSWLIKNYPDLSLAILSGFMIGALRSVWPFWSYDYAFLPLKLEKGAQIIPIEPILPSLQSNEVIFAFISLMSGFLVFFAIEFLAKRKNKLST